MTIVFFGQVRTHYLSFFFKEEDVFLKETLEAAAWCQWRCFTDSVSLPMVTGMEGEKQEAAEQQSCNPMPAGTRKKPITRLNRSSSHSNQKDDCEFCVEMFDGRNLKVFASSE